jgi:uncharacterized protein YukE
MTGFIGMDVGAVRNLAGQLKAKAEEINTIANTLSSQLDSVQWVGPDASTFRSDWSGTHRAQLTAVADALGHAATRATQDADQQENASR